MKILPDENSDVRLKKLSSQEFEIFTVKDMGWNEIKNGKLIELITAYEFDFWIVVDKNVSYQQNLKTLSFTIQLFWVFLSALERIQKLLTQIQLALKVHLPERGMVIAEEK